MNQPLARKDGLIVQELPAEVLVYDALNDKAHCLNQTAALIWKFCDGKTTAAEIAQRMSRELGAAITEDYVWLALEQLERETLLEKQNRILAGKSKVSRRDLIKRIGVASVVALPIVTSIINPMSAKAGLCSISCGPGGDPAPCANDTFNCQPVCTSTNACANTP